MTICGVYRRQKDDVCGRVVRDHCGFWLELLNTRLRFYSKEVRWAECGRPEWGTSQFEASEHSLIERRGREVFEWNWIPPISPETEPELYGTDISPGALERKGLCVIRAALEEEQVEAAKKECEKWLERVGNPDGGRVGVVRFAGQCPGSWLVRGNRRIQRHFEELWSSQDLITSMDALFVWHPWEHIDDPQRTVGGWLHVDDHEPMKFVGRCTVQGLVALTRADESTGGFVCCLRDSQQWRYVVLERGDLVLWDSKLVHASEPGCDNTRFDFSTKLRLAVPVCMVPRLVADRDCLQKRRQLCVDGGTTKHSPHKCLSEEHIHHPGGGVLQWCHREGGESPSSFIDRMHPDILRVL